MMLLALFACGDVSNSVFEEDAAFVAALPTEEHHTMDVPGSGLTAKAELGETPELLAVSISVATDVNSAIFDILGTVDEVRALPPSHRTANSRGWGPYLHDGVDVTATIERSGAGRFDWVFAGERAEEAAPVVWGTHYAGQTVAEGDGEFTWDHAAWGRLWGQDTAGELVVDYDNRDGVDLLVQLAGVRTGGTIPWDASYAYRFVDEAGDFQYLTTYDLPDDGSNDPAAVRVRTRWLPTVGGRSDAVLTGGGLADRTMSWTQCWGVDLTLSYQHDSLGVTEDLGDPASCAWGDFAEVDRL